MRILYTNFHSGNGGGHVTYVLALARGLSADHDITVASPAGSPLFIQAAQVPGVKAVAIDFKPRARAFLGQLLRLRNLISEQRFDIIHVNGSADHRQVMLATRGMRRPPSIVFTKHNDYPVHSFGNRLRGWFGTAHSIAVSDYVARLLANSPYRRATVVKHGVDTHRACHPELGLTAEARRIALFGVEGARRVVLGSVAGTSSYKGWMDLIDALALLPMHERERFSVLLAGELPDAEQLAHVSRRGLQEQVRFTGIVTDAEQVLGCSDVGFVLSHKETLSYACRESMAAGLPVIVSAAGGLTENVDDGINGWVVPVRNPLAISRVLRQILDAPESLAAMGSAARQKSVREFGLDAFLASTCAVYQLASETAPVVQTTDPSVRAEVRLR